MAKRTIEVDLPDDTEVKAKKTEAAAPPVKQEKVAEGESEEQGQSVAPATPAAGTGTDAGGAKGVASGSVKKPVKKVRCDVCGEMVHPRFLALHMNNKHGKGNKKKSTAGGASTSANSSDPEDGETDGISKWIKEHVVETAMIVISAVAVLCFLYLAVRRPGGEEESGEAVAAEQRGEDVQVPAAAPVILNPQPTASEIAMKQQGMTHRFGEPGPGEEKFNVALLG